MTVRGRFAPAAALPILIVMLSATSVRAGVGVNGAITRTLTGFPPIQQIIGSQTAQTSISREIGDIDSDLRTSAMNFPGGRSAEVSAGINLNSVAGGVVPNQVTQTQQGFGQAGIFDTLSLSGAHTGDPVTLHARLDLEMHPSSGPVSTDPLPNNNRYDVFGSNDISVVSAGSILAGNSKSHMDFHAHDGAFVSTPNNGVIDSEFLDFSLAMSFGSSSEYDLLLLDQFSETFSETGPNDSTFGLFDGGRASLSFLDGISITDNVTGQDLCGLTVRTSSGDVFGETAACPGGPGGGNPGPGGVPEPATWALMLSGFGLAGILLRRRGERPVQGEPS